MNEINTDHLLTQIRTLNASLDAPPSATIRADEPQAPANNFGNLLKSSLDSVNELQSQSRDLKTAFERGDTNVSLAEAMIASQKADLSFRAMSEVRNKLVTAYQEIMNMPV
ncbi:MAG: flagellar hook-basal body complex protein FliE [Pseudomonadota bacterium]